MKIEKLNSFKRNSEYGFTLIELIVIIIMIGIMAATVVPRLLSSKGFEEHVYRDELITTLRNIQLRTMQQTSISECQTVKLSSFAIGLLATEEETCTSSFVGDTTTVSISSGHDVSFSIKDDLTSFCFSTMGKPINCATNNELNAIMISVIGESNQALMVNSEGYIYAL